MIASRVHRRYVGRVWVIIGSGGSLSHLVCVMCLVTSHTGGVIIGGETTVLIRPE